MSSSSPERRRRWNVLRKCSPPDPVLHEPVEQLQDDEFLAGDHHVGAVAALGPDAEKVPRLVDRLGPAGQDEGPGLAQTIGVGDHFIGAGTVDLHAATPAAIRGTAPSSLASLTTEVGVPLPQDDARLFKPGLVHGGGNGPGPGRQQARVGIKERAQDVCVDRKHSKPERRSRRCPAENATVVPVLDTGLGACSGRSWPGSTIPWDTFLADCRCRFASMQSSSVPVTDRGDQAKKRSNQAFRQPSHKKYHGKVRQIGGFFQGHVFDNPRELGPQCHGFALATVTIRQLPEDKPSCYSGAAYL